MDETLHGTDRGWDESVGVSCAEGKARLHSGSGDQSIGQLNAMGESVLFDEDDGCGANRFGEGQDSELELAKRLLDLARFQLGSGALKKFHQGNYGQGANRRVID